MTRPGHLSFSRVTLLLVLLGMLALPLSSRAEEGIVAAADEPAPWRGTTLSYRNVASAISINKDAELTYNPYYAMSMAFAPRWWFGKFLGLGADVDMTRELTNADYTTKDGEFWLGDVRGSILARAPKIPVAGIVFGGGFTAIAPTSKMSQARTLIVGLRPQLTVSRTFPLLSGLTLSYVVQGTRNLNRYTTSERELPLIPGCLGSAGECDRFYNTGARNAKWRLTNAAAISMDFFDWLGISADVAVVVDYLYKQEAVDDRVSFEPQEPTDQRYYMSYGVELYGQPMPSLSLALGLSTSNPQLAPDSTPEKPFINRYTEVYFDMRFHIDGFISQIVSTGGGK